MTQRLCHSYRLSEVEFIRNIVERISELIDSTPHEEIVHGLVGIRSPVEEMNLYLDIESKYVRFIGICRMSGMGKTTLAKVVFERIHRKFDACSFLENVRESSEDPNGLQKLQDQLLRDMKLKTKGDLRKGTQVIRNRLGDKSVLIVVDDVSKTRQLENLVGKLDWFGPRIIITTNDKRLLASYQVHMGFSKKEDINLCKVKGLNNDEALQLFKQKAFHRHPSVKMI